MIEAISTASVAPHSPAPTRTGSGLNSATLARPIWQADGVAAAAAAAAVSGNDAYSSCGGANCCGMTTGSGRAAAFAVLLCLTGCGRGAGASVGSGTPVGSGAAMVGTPLGMLFAAGFCAAAIPVVLTSTATTTAHFTRLPQRHCGPCLGHDPEKWKPVFGKDHAQIGNKPAPLQASAAPREDMLPRRARRVTFQTIKGKKAGRNKGHADEGLPTTGRNAMLGLMQDWPLLCHRIIDHAALNHGGRQVISRSVEGPIHTTNYIEVRARALRVAQRLERDGIKQGDRVATLAWNTWRHLEAWYGIMGMGAVYHTINPRLFAEQIIWIVNHAEDRIMMVDLTFVPILEKLAEKLKPIEKYVVLTDTAHMPATALRNAVSYEEWIEGADGDYAWKSFDENTAAGMCYT